MPSSRPRSFGSILLPVAVVAALLLLWWGAPGPATPPPAVVVPAATPTAPAPSNAPRPRPSSAAPAEVPAQARSGPDGIVATLRIESTVQFSPTDWYLQIPVPAGTGLRFLDSEPMLCVERQGMDLRWRRVANLTTLHAATTEPSSERVTLRLLPGGTLSYWHDLADVRVLGEPGHLRARVQFGVAGEPAARFTEWVTFDVAPAGTSGRGLLAAQRANDAAWQAFATCMARALPFPRWDTFAPRAPRNVLTDALLERDLAPLHAARTVADLPARAAHRLRLLEACLGARVAMTECAERLEVLRTMDRTCEDLRQLHGFYGEVAGLLQVWTWQQRRDAGRLAEVGASPWSADRIAVAASLPGSTSLWPQPAITDPSQGPPPPGLFWPPR